MLEQSLVDWAEEQAEASGVPEKAGGILLEAPEPAPCQRRLLLTEDHADTRRLLGAEVCDGAELLEHLSAAVDEHRLAARGIAVVTGAPTTPSSRTTSCPSCAGWTCWRPSSARAARALHPDHGVRR